MTDTGNQGLKRSDMLAELKAGGYGDIKVDGELPECKYYQFDHKGTTINVQTTAENIFDSMTRFPVNIQTGMMMIIAKRVPEPGDSVPLMDDDSDQKAKHNRKAFVVRLKGAPNEINLMITC